ncbi:DUF418 domain-containing protein [Pseudoalteromonas fenneropenaei]|uniref:DUF418 domain-containing protein n=1 Tax=Pseudoalteromonas fenneropenaei TaxID=1737459 RepID=A0ABV7CME6_9GAMM
MQRLTQLDVIRGFAVLGLLVMNAPFFGLFEHGYVSAVPTHWLDTYLHAFTLAAVDGRFRTLFCLLFGVAVAIQASKINGLARVQARNHALIALGLIHGFLIWAGDILFVYGCAGLLLANCVEHTGERNLRRGLGLLFAISGVLGLAVAIEPPLELTRSSETFQNDYARIYASLTSLYLDNLKNAFFMTLLVPFLTLWYTFAVMRIGLGAWQLGWFHSLLPTRVFIIGSVLALLFTALTLALAFSGVALYKALSEALNWLSALFFAVPVVQLLLYLARTQHLFAQILAPVGRVALTCYLTQSVIGVLCFRVFFPHWVLTFDYIDYYLFSAVVVTTQVLVAHLYLSYFRQGPCEWLLARWLKQANVAEK